MLQNAYFLAKIGADTAENEQHFAEIMPTDALWRRRLAGKSVAYGMALKQVSCPGFRKVAKTGVIYVMDQATKSGSHRSMMSGILTGKLKQIIIETKRIPDVQ